MLDTGWLVLLCDSESERLRAGASLLPPPPALPIASSSSWELQSDAWTASSRNVHGKFIDEQGILDFLAKLDLLFLDKLLNMYSVFHQVWRKWIKLKYYNLNKVIIKQLLHTKNQEEQWNRTFQHEYNFCCMNPLVSFVPSETLFSIWL